MSFKSGLKKQIRLFVGSLKGGRSIRQLCDDRMLVGATSRFLMGYNFMNFGTELESFRESSQIDKNLPTINIL